MTTGIEWKVTGMIGKTLFLPLVAWFFVPMYDAIILLVVTDYSSLSPVVKSFLNDSKLVLGLLVMIFTLVRLIMGSYKIKKEIEALKEKK